jgi:hypothetical protein
VAVKRGNRGGPRKGAGRKPVVAGEVRNNRVVVLLTNVELKTLKKYAKEEDLPIGTAAYKLMAGALKRRK